MDRGEQRETDGSERGESGDRVREGEWGRTAEVEGERVRGAGGTRRENREGGQWTTSS